MYRFGGVLNRQHKHILQFVIYYCQQNRISDNYTQWCSMIMVEMQNLGSYGGNLGVSRWVAGKYGKGSMEVLGQ